jgi:serine protease Do
VTTEPSRPSRAGGLAIAGVAIAVALAFVGGRATAPHGWASYADTYRQVAPGVVGVSLDDPEPRIGSGFAVSPTQVVTARHLVVGAEEVAIHTFDGTVVTARVVGSDARTDLALVEASDGAFTPVVLGSSAELEVGDTVLAIGNPFGLGHSLAVGVVGNLDRRLADDANGPHTDFLQLTMPLNPGNSGGPVFDELGRVVAVLSGIHAQGQAIAFAIPVEALESTLPALQEGEQLSRAFLGARTETVDGGVAIASVTAGGPADHAGLRTGDRITSIDGAAVGSPDAFHAMLDHLAAGTDAQIGIVRDGTPQIIAVELSDWAEHPLVVAGMTLRPVAGAGGEVVAVRPQSRADRAGVHIGDIVHTVDGLPVQAPADVQEALGGRAHGLIEVVRDGQPVVVQLPEPG